MLRKTLWMLVLQGEITDQLHFFYAENPDEAEEISHDLEQEHGAKRRDLRNWPRGFRVVTFDLVGSITVPDDE